MKQIKKECKKFFVDINILFAFALFLIFLVAPIMILLFVFLPIFPDFLWLIIILVALILIVLIYFIIYFLSKSLHFAAISSKGVEIKTFTKRIAHIEWKDVLEAYYITKSSAFRKRKEDYWLVLDDGKGKLNRDSRFIEKDELIKIKASSDLIEFISQYWSQPIKYKEEKTQQQENSNINIE